MALAAAGARSAALVALARYRLRRAPGARLAFVLTIVTAVVSTAIAAVVRVRRGNGAELDGVIATTAGMLAWLGAAPVAFAAAHDRIAADHREGIDLLAASRGFCGQ